MKRSAEDDVAPAPKRAAARLNGCHSPPKWFGAVKIPGEGWTMDGVTHYGAALAMLSLRGRISLPIEMIDEIMTTYAERVIPGQDAWYLVAFSVMHDISLGDHYRKRVSFAFPEGLADPHSFLCSCVMYNANGRFNPEIVCLRGALGNRPKPPKFGRSLRLGSDLGILALNPRFQDFQSLRWALREMAVNEDAGFCCLEVKSVVERSLDGTIHNYLRACAQCVVQDLLPIFGRVDLVVLRDSVNCEDKGVEIASKMLGGAGCSPVEIATHCIGKGVTATRFEASGAACFGARERMRACPTRGEDKIRADHEYALSSYPSLLVCVEVGAKEMPPFDWLRVYDFSSGKCQVLHVRSAIS